MTAAPAAPSYTRSDWSSAFRNVGQELSDVVLEPTRGQIPDALAGVLYRNGPGRQHINMSLGIARAAAAEQQLPALAVAR